MALDRGGQIRVLGEIVFYDRFELKVYHLILHDLLIAVFGAEIE
jgi:hypothetical protein